MIERNLFVLGNLAQNFMEELETRSIQDVSVESTIEVFLHHFKNKVAGIKSRALQVTFHGKSPQSTHFRMLN